MRLKKRIADKKSELFGLYSDIYKDENGFRPRWSKEEYESATEEEIQELIDEISSRHQKERDKKIDNDNKLKESQPEYESIKKSLYEEYVKLSDKLYNGHDDISRFQTIEDLQDIIDRFKQELDFYGESDEAIQKKQEEKDKAEDEYNQSLENGVKQRHMREKHSSKKRLIRIADVNSQKENYIANELKKQSDEENLALGIELGCEWADGVVEFTDENLESLLKNICSSYKDAFRSGWESDVNYSDDWLFVNTDNTISSARNLQRVIDFEDMASKLMQNPTTDNVPESVVKVLSEG